MTIEFRLIMHATAKVKAKASGLALGLAITRMLACPLNGAEPGGGLTEESKSFLDRPSPYPGYRAPAPGEYTSKWGRLSLRMDATVFTEFNDNINLTESNREFDISISPIVHFGLFWPATKAQMMQLDLGVGYRWYLNTPELNTVQLVPNSHWNYRLKIYDVDVDFHDNFSVQNDATYQTEISGTTARGTGSTALDFRRFNNTAGLLATWHPIKPLRILGGYDYIINNSLSDQFQFYDYSSHYFTASSEYDFSARWTAGLTGSYFITQFDQAFQNDGDGYSVGPSVVWRPHRRVTVAAAVSYSVATYDTTGLSGDTSNFSGLTYQVGISHQLTERASHRLQVGRRNNNGLSQSLAPGLGSNFTDQFSVDYSLTQQMTRLLGLTARAAYYNISTSGALHEVADLYILSLGTGFNLARTWRLGVAYVFAYRDSVQAGSDYYQNRVILDLSHSF